MSNSESKNQPVQEIRMGLIKAAIWANPPNSNEAKSMTLGSRSWSSW